jgi:hypothetical protein
VADILSLALQYISSANPISPLAKMLAVSPLSHKSSWASPISESNFKRQHNFSPQIKVTVQFHTKFQVPVKLKQ